MPYLTTNAPGEGPALEWKWTDEERADAEAEADEDTPEGTLEQWGADHE